MFGHGTFDTHRTFRDEGYDDWKAKYPCSDVSDEQLSGDEAVCREEVVTIPSCMESMESLEECYCKCKDNPNWRAGESGHTAWVPTFDSNSMSPYNSNNNEKNDDGLECKSEDCPKNHMAVKKTDSNGVETCECVSGEAIGDGIKTIGTVLVVLAVGGVVTTGLIVYGIYRIIRG